MILTISVFSNLVFFPIIIYVRSITVMHLVGNNIFPFFIPICQLLRIYNIYTRIYSKSFFHDIQYVIYLSFGNNVTEIGN